MNAKALVGYVALAFVVWWVIENPHSASQVIQNIGHLIDAGTSGLSHLVASI